MLNSDESRNVDGGIVDGDEGIADERTRVLRTKKIVAQIQELEGADVCEGAISKCTEIDREGRNVRSTLDQRCSDFRVEFCSGINTSSEKTGRTGKEILQPAPLWGPSIASRRGFRRVIHPFRTPRDPAV